MDNSQGCLLAHIVLYHFYLILSRCLNYLLHEWINELRNSCLQGGASKNHE